MLKVVSKRAIAPEVGWIDIYIGRPSPLGNPFVMKSETEREKVCAQYRQWLWSQIKNKTVAFIELQRITKLVKSGQKVRLVCFCAPKQCHGDQIKRAVEWLVAQEPLR